MAAARRIVSGLELNWVTTTYLQYKITIEMAQVFACSRFSVFYGFQPFCPSVIKFAYTTPWQRNWHGPTPLHLCSSFSFTLDNSTHISSTGYCLYNCLQTIGLLDSAPKPSIRCPKLYHPTTENDSFRWQCQIVNIDIELTHPIGLHALPTVIHCALAIEGYHHFIGPHNPLLTVESKESD